MFTTHNTEHFGFTIRLVLRNYWNILWEANKKTNIYIYSLQNLGTNQPKEMIKLRRLLMIPWENLLKVLLKLWDLHLQWLKTLRQERKPIMILKTLPNLLKTQNHRIRRAKIKNDEEQQWALPAVNICVKLTPDYMHQNFVLSHFKFEKKNILF